MRPTISPTPTGGVPNAKPSRPWIYSIARLPRPLVVGHGIANVSNADALIAENMGPTQRSCATPVCGLGEKRTPLLRQQSTNGVTFNKNTACRRIRWKRCAVTRPALAPSASVEQPVYLSTIVIPRVTYERCFAKRATRSWVGTKKKQTPFCGSSNTLRRIANSKPCHADVLLELANRRGDQDDEG